MSTIAFGTRPGSGRSSENPRSLTLEYVLAGIADRATARAYGIAATPTIQDGLFRQEVQLDPAGYNVWHISVQYGARKKPEPNDYRWSFDTTGGTARITQAKEHIQSYGTSPGDHKGAIGVSKPGEPPEGTEIVIPSFKWSETWQLDAAAVPWSYSQTLKALTGRVNNGTFRGFAAGEVLFLGAQGSASNADPEIVEITYQFIQSDNVTGLTVGDISSIAKAGWQYLWIQYETTEDATNDCAVQQPVAVYVERVYDTADFSLLGIGTT